MSNDGRRTENVAVGFRIMSIFGLPPIKSSSTTMLPRVKDCEPELPCRVRQEVLVPQVDPLPLWK